MDPRVGHLSSFSKKKVKVPGLNFPFFRFEVNLGHISYPLNSKFQLTRFVWISLRSTLSAPWNRRDAVTEETTCWRFSRISSFTCFDNSSRKELDGIRRNSLVLSAGWVLCMKPLGPDSTNWSEVRMISVQVLICINNSCIRIELVFLSWQKNQPLVCPCRCQRQRHCRRGKSHPRTRGWTFRKYC